MGARARERESGGAAPRRAAATPPAPPRCAPRRRGATGGCRIWRTAGPRRRCGPAAAPRATAVPCATAARAAPAPSRRPRLPGPSCSACPVAPDWWPGRRRPFGRPAIGRPARFAPRCRPSPRREPPTAGAGDVPTPDPHTHRSAGRHPAHPRAPTTQWRRPSSSTPPGLRPSPFSTAACRACARRRSFRWRGVGRGRRRGGRLGRADPPPAHFVSVSPPLQPIDMVKVRLQLGATGGPVSSGGSGTGRGGRGTGAAPVHAPALCCSQFAVAGQVIKEYGVSGLYKGLSAGLLRQATYTTARLGIFNTLSESLKKVTLRVAPTPK